MVKKEQNHSEETVEMTEEQEGQSEEIEATAGEEAEAQEVAEQTAETVAEQEDQSEEIEATAGEEAEAQEVAEQTAETVAEQEDLGQETVTSVEQLGDQDQMLTEASFEALYEESLKSIKEGEVVRGSIIQVTDDYVMVDIGYKSEGQISVNEFKDEEGKVTAKVVDEVDVLLESHEDE